MVFLLLLFGCLCSVTIIRGSMDCLWSVLLAFPGHYHFKKSRYLLETRKGSRTSHPFQYQPPNAHTDDPRCCSFPMSTAAWNGLNIKATK